MTEDVPTGVRRYDAFGRPITLNTKNVADLASHYPYSPERHRIYVDDQRQFIAYDGEPAQYEDTVDSHLLKPQADGEVVRFETTEIYRYVVGYVLELTAALQTNQALQGDDVVVSGYGDADLENGTGNDLGPAADGYFWIWDADTPDRQVKTAVYRNGTEKTSRMYDTETALTEWTRRAMEINWYNVGATVMTETFTKNGTQRNPVVGRMSVDNEKGPETGNHHFNTAVKTGSAGAGSLELELGSIGVRIFGDTDPVFRRKTVDTEQTISTTGTFVPFYAIRIDPNRAIVNVELTDIRVPEFSGNGDITVIAQAFAPEKLRDSGGNDIVDGDFSVPVELSAQNSVIEESTAVDQFPDSGGTIGTSADNPGGYQEGYAANYSTTGGSRDESVSQQSKRLINERDIVVFLARASATGDVTIEYVTEQQW